jgi:hypothetical protein
MRFAFLSLLLFAASCVAQTTVPNTFVAGTPAKAADVNANFSALATAIDQGIRGYQIVSQTYTSTALTTGPAPTFSSNCPTGKMVLGGGFSGQTLGAPGANGGVPAVLVLSSRPGGIPGQPNGTQWQVQVFNNTNVDQTIVVTAICATASP